MPKENAGASPRKRRHLFSDCSKRLPPSLSPSTSQSRVVGRKVATPKPESQCLLHDHDQCLHLFAFNDFASVTTLENSKN